MDTSETYIKMCEKAEEIQECFHTPLPPGTFWVRKSEGFYSEGITGYDYKRLPEWVILPRQDQLQEMVQPETNPANQLFVTQDNFLFGIPGYLWSDDFGYDNDEEEITYYRQFTSMEQLWFAFVMKEKWGKVRSGTDWVVEV